MEIVDNRTIVLELRGDKSHLRQPVPFSSCPVEV
jgi:hypothetical protein